MTRTAAQVRQEFIDFFRQRCGHVFVPSSPVVPLDDPTLLFTNAGMNQFKPYFLGTETPKHVRVANSQKCIRAGGKHNDLDDVGHDTYHHTFFEMLGNWSFGDYFKAEAIAWAWELLVDAWGIDPTRLHATYFGGDAAEGLEPDLQARDLWLKILPRERVHPGNKKDNFWEMGDTGPCGPCSEIHIDLTRDKSGARLVNAGTPQVIEIWNLVFIQFNRGGDGALTPLPAKHVDTGMGFERVTAVLQGHNNNYATDVFVPIIQAIERISGHTYGARGVTMVDSSARENRYARLVAGDMRDEACRVIADHIRCLTFALTDGAVPDREGRGFVLRRILRRAVRFGWQHLSLHEPFLCELVPTVVEVMGDAFPELRKDPQHVQAVIREEEESFERTLDRGIALFEEAAEYARLHHHGEIRGEDVFKLHDTYGFPIDLTEVMAQEKGLRVDIGEYERLMEAARERARARPSDVDEEDVAKQIVQCAPSLRFGATDDSAKYVCDRVRTELLGIVPVRSGARVTPWVSNPAAGAAASPLCVLQAGEEAALFFRETCFYTEQGGQVADTGTITGESGIFEVKRAERFSEAIAHIGTMLQGQLRAGQTVELRVEARRAATMKNHTATHIMNWALREVLGDHVQQKGSLVDPDKTRFDFSHPKALTPDEVARVEQLVRDKIRQKLPVYHQEVPQEQALKVNGLRAVFGERYPDMVRVLSVGVPVDELITNPGNAAWRGVSVEFCGGTHVSNTGEIEQFAILSEEAVAKGVRRIVAVTGDAAKKALELGAELTGRADRLGERPAAELAGGLAELQAALASATIPLTQRHGLHERIAQLQRAVKEQHKAEAAEAAGAMRAKVDGLIAAAEKVGDTYVIISALPDVSVEQLKVAADTIKQKCRSAAVVFGVGAVATEREASANATEPERKRGTSEPRTEAEGPSAGKVLLLAAMTDDLVKRGLKAGDLVKAIAPLVGGGGGGPPTLAQAGGKNPERLCEALESARAWLKQRL